MTAPNQTVDKINKSNFAIICTLAATVRNSRLLGEFFAVFRYAFVGPETIHEFSYFPNQQPAQLRIRERG